MTSPIRPSSLNLPDLQASQRPSYGPSDSSNSIATQTRMLRDCIKVEPTQGLARYHQRLLQACVKTVAKQGPGSDSSILLKACIHQYGPEKGVIYYHYYHAEFSLEKATDYLRDKLKEGENLDNYPRLERLLLENCTENPEHDLAYYSGYCKDFSLAKASDLAHDYYEILEKSIEERGLKAGLAHYYHHYEGASLVESINLVESDSRLQSSIDKRGEEKGRSDYYALLLEDCMRRQGFIYYYHHYEGLPLLKAQALASSYRLYLLSNCVKSSGASQALAHDSDPIFKDLLQRHGEKQSLAHYHHFYDGLNFRNAVITENFPAALFFLGTKYQIEKCSPILSRTFSQMVVPLDRRTIFPTHPSAQIIEIPRTDINALDSVQGSQLHAAAARGHEAGVRFLLEQKAAVDNACVEKENPMQGRTALMEAAANGSLPVALLLLEAKAAVNAKDVNQHTPFMFAAKNGHALVASKLLERGAQPTSKDTEIALTRAIHHGYVDFAHLVLQRIKKPQLFQWAYIDGNVNAVNDQGQTLLMLCVQGNNPEAVEWLLLNGADSSITDSHGKTASDYIDVFSSGPLKAALKTQPGDVEVFKKQSAYSLIDRNVYGQTLLMWASKKGYVDIMQHLVFSPSFKASLNLQDRNRTTALMMAVSSKCKKEGIQLLLDAQADICTADNNGETAITKAAEQGDPVILEMLLSALAKSDKLRDAVNISKGWFSSPPLSRAAAGGHVEAVKLLLRYGAKVNGVDLPQSGPRQDSRGTPLTAAAYGGSTLVTQILVDAGADINDDRTGNTALMIAAEDKSRRGIFDYLLQQPKIKLDTGDDYGRTVLDIALKNQPELIQPILKKDPTLIDRLNPILDRTLLIAAVQDGDAKAVRTLLDLGANRDVVTKTGWTALRFATVNKNGEIMKLLQSHGVNPMSSVVSSARAGA